MQPWHFSVTVFFSRWSDFLFRFESIKVTFILLSSFSRSHSMLFFFSRFSIFSNLLEWFVINRCLLYTDSLAIISFAFSEISRLEHPEKMHLKTSWIHRCHLSYLCHTLQWQLNLPVTLSHVLIDPRNVGRDINLFSRGFGLWKFDSISIALGLPIFQVHEISLLLEN